MHGPVIVEYGLPVDQSKLESGGTARKPSSTIKALA